MGNTVGSMDTHFCDLFNSQEGAYILGVWCADGYHRTSSIGISTTNKIILEKFYKFLIKLFPKEKLRLKFYYPWCSSKEDKSPWHDKVGKIESYFSFKAKCLAYHCYVNSRSLLRYFQLHRKALKNWNERKLIRSYFAGRFDGDGSISRDGKKDCRIVYSH